MDLLALRLRLAWISDHPQNMFVVHNGQLKHSDLRASIVGIQLNIYQLNFRFNIERIQKRNESVAPSPRS